MKFYKSRMMARLKKENLLDQVTDEIQEIMDDLDGQEATESC